MIVNCSYCNQEFDKPTNKVNEYNKKGYKLYCSDKCKKDSKKIKCNCVQCGKELFKTKSELEKSKSGNTFCSKSCACSYNNSHYRTKENNPNWKGGQFSGKTYQKIAFRNYYPICSICGFSHKKALEVHHVDKDPTNDELDNLIILCCNCHSLVHLDNLEITEEIKKNRKLMEV